MADEVVVNISAIFAGKVGSRAPRNLSATDTHQTATRHAFDDAFSLTMAGMGPGEVARHSARLGDVARHRGGVVGEGLVLAVVFEEATLVS